MSSPAFSFSPWRRRGSSVHSSDRGTEDPPTNQQTAPAPPGQPQALDSRLLSSSISSAAHREPIRSFIQGSFREYHVPVESVQQHARSVREDTAELATYQLSDHAERRSPSFLSRQRSLSLSSGRIGPGYDHVFEDDDSSIPQDAGSDTIPEVSEPPSPEDTGAAGGEVGPSLLAHMLRQSPPSAMETATQHDIVEQRDDHSTVRERRLKKASIPSASSNQDMTETTPLLGSLSPETQPANGEYHLDLEGQKARVPRRIARAVAQLCKRVGPPFVAMTRSVKDPKLYSRRSLWENGIVAPVACLPAVIVGLLLNILDALSYGMILFPLGNPIFAHLGSAGISIFYVSTIVAQLTFSCGSVFRGGVGSELIEVVPFFHSMAAKITASVGEDNPEAVIATTIVAYALSSMLTGTVFYCMGKFKFGYLVGFIPRHILIGCIGGVGWFLVATGFEVSARIEGSLEYNLDTLYKLMSSETIPLWVTPLCLAIVLFWGQKRTNNKYFLPLYIIAIPIIFYFFVLSLDALDTNTLRDGGWIFEGPPAGEPWWYFYTLYQFNKVQWAALLETVPAMFALTFFGILHVPINVPALALNTGEDHADLDRELKLHGYSNFLSGACGSIQNYLVYANTVFFMRSGGDSRLAGFELAALTFGVMTIGPALIGYIPIMMVGCLIFDLGFELLLEAVWQPRKKFKLPEYVTVIAIVLIMGIYDFVVGIGVGILLAFVSMILQTSRVSAIRTAYSGEIVNSTVRRNPSQQHYLKQVGKQIQIIKLAGYLFFGTIVGVENRIRSLIAEETFSHRPIRYLILDLHQVTGLDYSAGEAFNTISRLLDGKGIHLVLSGLDDECSLARDLRAVGLGDGGIDVSFLPNLNSALESCENELLKTFYASQEALRVSRLGQAVSLDVPSKPDQLPSGDLLASSPRLNQLQEAAKVSLNKAEVLRLSRWQNFKEPLRLILQIFQDLSDKNEDFWFRAVGYFVRKECASGSILFRRGEPADGFYLIEKGILRADYDLPHGQYFHESIVAGTTCGELPFFSETTRTATACAELDCVVWVLNNESWKRLQTDDPDVAQELLKIGLKLTAERMNTVPASTMLMAE